MLRDHQQPLPQAVEDAVFISAQLTSKLSVGSDIAWPRRGVFRQLPDQLGVQAGAGNFLWPGKNFLPFTGGLHADQPFCNLYSKGKLTCVNTW